MNGVRPASRATNTGAPLGDDVPTAEVTVRSLGSGSSGNALLITSRAGAVLVDCGIERTALQTRLAATGHQPAAISALLLTHEHGDHAHSRTLFTGAGVPVVATAGTIAALGLTGTTVEPIAPGGEVPVNGFSIVSLAVSHDARQPCGFSISVAGSRITIFTDLGSFDSSQVDVIQESDLVVLEANHDVGLLKLGPYPTHLKRRILSARGHLSNDASGCLLASALSRSHRSPTIWLAHLSRTNNQPELARTTVLAKLSEFGVTVPIIALPRTASRRAWRSGERPPRQLTLPW